ncbi:MAG: HEAT repeat domain-containing protein [Planctomycetaceae bacterium]|nr:HEAT repeat domain-containing protein [Planctomycetaceae bacterium]
MRILATILFLAVMATPAFGIQSPDPPKTYGDFTLAEWRERIKSIPLPVLGNPQDVHALLEIVSDQDAPWPDRRQAALTLGRIGEPARQAIPVLVDLLRSERSQDETTLLWILKSLTYFQTLAEPAFPDVAKIVSDADRPHLIRVAAMETLAEIGANHSETLPTLIGVIQSASEETSADWELQLAACDALWILGPNASGAIPDLLQLARSRWSPLRLSAMQTIGKVGPAADIAVAPVVDVVLFDDVGEVREAAADALATMGPQGISSLAQLCQDREPEVRLLAIRGLKLSGSPSARLALESALSDPDPLVSVQAAAALATLDPSSSPAWEALIRHLPSEIRRVRLIAYQTLLRNVDRLEPYAERLREIAESDSAPEQSRSGARRLYTTHSTER